MGMSKVAAIFAGMVLGTAGGVAFELSNASAAESATRTGVEMSRAQPAITTSVAPCARMSLALAFTNNVTDLRALDLHLPWGEPGGAEGPMIEDYGAYDGTTVREQLPVHDVTTGALVEMSGHNAVDIALPSGTPLHAVTSGTAYRMTNWTIPGGPQGWAIVVVSDRLNDDHGEPIAFLYGHVREFDVEDGRHVASGALIARSGGDPGDPGHGFSDMANVHFEAIESTHPLLAHAGTVNPHRFLENLYGDAASTPACVL